MNILETLELRSKIIGIFISSCYFEKKPDLTHSKNGNRIIQNQCILILCPINVFLEFLEKHFYILEAVKIKKHKL